MYHPVPEAVIAASGNDSAAAFTALSAGLARGLPGGCAVGPRAVSGPSRRDQSICIGAASRPRRKEHVPVSPRAGAVH
jgi:hypothetical protein